MIYQISNEKRLYKEELTKYQIAFSKTTGKVILKCPKLRERNNLIEKKF